MALADFAAGANNAIQEILKKRLLEQRYQDSLKQQAFQNDLATRGANRADQQLAATTENNRLLRERQGLLDQSLLDERAFNSEDRAKRTAIEDRETIPPGADIASDSPRWNSLNRFGLITGTVKQPGGMGSSFQGPMPTGEDPQAVANDTPRIISAAPTMKQRDTLADNERQAAKDAADEQFRQQQLEISRGQLRVAQQNANNKPAGSVTAPTVTPTEVQDTLDLIDKISNDPALPNAVGPFDQYGVGMVSDITGVNRFVNLYNELVGKLSLAQAGKLRGQGQISDKERALLREAATSLGRNMSEEDFRKELSNIRSQFQRMQTPMAPSHTSPDATAPPTAADLIKKYGGQNAGRP